MSKANEHPPAEQLLRLSDGELTAREAATVRAHLELCWRCRSHFDEIAAGIADYMRYDEKVLKPLLPPPPRPWPDLSGRIEGLESRVPPRVRWVPRGWMLATAAVLLVLISVIRFEHVPEVSAAELLRKAAAAEVAAPARPRRIQVRSRHRTFTRAASFLKNPSPVPDDLQKLFVEAHYDWDNPLSVAAYRSWRDQLTEKEEDVQTSATNYVVRTRTAGSSLAETTLTLNARDLHAERETFQFRAGEFVEISDAGEEESSPPVAAPLRKAEPALAKDSAGEPVPGPSEELQAVAALHRIAADLGEPIELTRHGSKLMVAAMGLSLRRQEQVREAFGHIPGVEVRFDRPELLTSPPSVLAPPHRATPGTLNALQLRLQSQLGDPASVETFVDKVLDASEAALARAHALRTLARRFPREVEGQLSFADRVLLVSVRTDHLHVLASRARELDQLLKPSLSQLGAPSEGGATTTPAPDWQTLAAELFTATQHVDQLLNAMLAGSDGAGNPPPASLSAALNRLKGELAAENQ